MRSWKTCTVDVWSSECLEDAVLLFGQSGQSCLGNVVWEWVKGSEVSEPSFAAWYTVVHKHMTHSSLRKCYRTFPCGVVSVASLLLSRSEGLLLRVITREVSERSTINCDCWCTITCNSVFSLILLVILQCPLHNRDLILFNVLIIKLIWVTTSLGANA